MPQNSPRNRTGTFLGMAASVTDTSGDNMRTPRSSNPIIPPLQIGRGRYIRTPSEANRYRKVEAIREKETYKGFTGISLNTAPRPKTSPAECHYRRKTQQKKSQGIQPTSEEIIQLTRQNPRNFTAVNNHGVSHKEYLAYPDESTDDDINTASSSIDLATSLARAAAMTGPTQYYNTLCGNNPEALKTLLSNKRFGWPTNQYTGFNVRSYRKPPTAELLANLDNTRHSGYARPKTAASQLTARQLLVPQPYIYRSSTNGNRRVLLRPMTTPGVYQPKPNPIPFSDEVLEMYDKPIPVAVPVPGGDSAINADNSAADNQTMNNTGADNPTSELPALEAQEDKQITNSPVVIDNGSTDPPPNSVVPNTSPTHPADTPEANPQTRTPDTTPDAHTPDTPHSDSPHSAVSPLPVNETPAQRADNPTSEHPVEAQQDKQITNVIGSFDTAMPIMKKTLSSKDHTNQTMSNNVNNTDLNAANADKTSDRMQLSPKINIAIETDDGYIQPPEIDEIEVQGNTTQNVREETSTSPSEDSQTRRYSITDRIQKIKLGEDAANTLKIEAEQRKKVLENLLEEHATIVRQISVGSSDVENSV